MIVCLLRRIERPVGLIADHWRFFIPNDVTPSSKRTTRRHTVLPACAWCDSVLPSGRGSVLERKPSITTEKNRQMMGIGVPALVWVQASYIPWRPAGTRQEPGGR